MISLLLNHILLNHVDRDSNINRFCNKADHINDNIYEYEDHINDNIFEYETFIMSLSWWNHINSNIDRFSQNLNHVHRNIYDTIMFEKVMFILSMGALVMGWFIYFSLLFYSLPVFFYLPKTITVHNLESYLIALTVFSVFFCIDLLEFILYLYCFYFIFRFFIFLVWGDFSVKKQLKIIPATKSKSSISKLVKEWFGGCKPLSEEEEKRRDKYKRRRNFFGTFSFLLLTFYIFLASKFFPPVYDKVYRYISGHEKVVQIVKRLVAKDDSILVVNYDESFYWRFGIIYIPTIDKLIVYILFLVGLFLFAFLRFYVLTWLFNNKKLFLAFFNKVLYFSNESIKRIGVIGWVIEVVIFSIIWITEWITEVAFIAFIFINCLWDKKDDFQHKNKSEILECCFVSLCILVCGLVGIISVTTTIYNIIFCSILAILFYYL